MEFGPGYVDVDEWREEPIRHRYVHGGFAGNATRFSGYFPEPDRYQHRFVQALQGGLGGSEHSASTGTIELAFDNGAYLVESNQGHSGDTSALKDDLSVLEWRASARSAEFAREIAHAMYGELPRHGYVFGGSGGAMRSVSCLEARPDLWQGAVPFMLNRSGLLAFNFSACAWATLVLDDKLDAIIDATAPGGCGDPFALLDNSEQREALAALYAAGFPRGAEPQLRPSPGWLFARIDPAYERDFWIVPGYEGTDRHPTIVAHHIHRLRTTIGEVIPYSRLRDCGPADDSNIENLSAYSARKPFSAETPVAVTLEALTPARRFINAQLRFVSGKSKDRSLFITGARGQALTAFWDPKGFREVSPGDEVEIDNSAYMAISALHRHMENLGYPEMAQIVAAAHARGAPHRDFTHAVRLPSGDFKGKMILLQHVHDLACMPDVARAYIRDVHGRLGDGVDGAFRIWWIDNAAHIPPVTKSGSTWLIDYCFAPAVRDVIQWVEAGTAPPPSTRYEFDDTNALRLGGANASDRLGIQPIASAAANGHPRADVKAGDTVCLTGRTDVPPLAGSIVRTEWDPEGAGNWTERRDYASNPSVAQHEHLHQYNTRGVYFPSFRVTSNRDGITGSPLYNVTNLSRVRVVVT